MYCFCSSWYSSLLSMDLSSSVWFCWLSIWIWLSRWWFSSSRFPFSRVNSCTNKVFHTQPLLPIHVLTLTWISQASTVNTNLMISLQKSLCWRFNLFYRRKQVCCIITDCFHKLAGKFPGDSKWQSLARSLTSQWLSSLVMEMSRPWCFSLSWSKRACQRFSSSCDSFREVFNSLLWSCSPSYSSRKRVCFCDSLQIQSQLLHLMVTEFHATSINLIYKLSFPPSSTENTKHATQPWFQQATFDMTHSILHIWLS